MDREGRHKGGVLILVKNNIPARDFQVDTNQQAEINGVKITVDSTVLTIFNLYCPPDKELSLQTLDIPAEKLLGCRRLQQPLNLLGLRRDGYRGEEVEDWQIDSKMILLNDPEDPPTFFSRRWVSSTTPDLAFATDDLSKKTTRGVQNQLGAATTDQSNWPSTCSTGPKIQRHFPDQYTKGIRVADQNINRAIDAFNKAILKAASEAIPRGARKNYRPYWTEELQELEDEVSKIREKVENDPTIENNIALKESSAKYRKACNEAARKRWREKTEELI
ncbi:hypothetical protein C0Q70_17972 [Pomacea canaliculata]|uniref:Uncharacterized protein n=1 Tax=Pomacea canaliculata TaxID=400727 RepID=A0A2T7NLW8_POMCA|nr:hypothetical protein C0Q70_17972 [Pomacea canaliculata]